MFIEWLMAAEILYAEEAVRVNQNETVTSYLNICSVFTQNS